MLLAREQFGLLVERYGYALCYGRNPVDAVRADLSRALSEGSGNKLLQVRANDLSGVFYEENAACLRAAIDCDLLISQKVMIKKSLIAGAIATVVCIIALLLLANKRSLGFFVMSLFGVQ